MTKEAIQLSAQMYNFGLIFSSYNLVVVVVVAVVMFRLGNPQIASHTESETVDL